MLRADLTQREVPPPAGSFCRSGHVALPVFRRESGRAEEPTRFFEVSSVACPGINGVYCEPCLIVANAAAKLDGAVVAGREGLTLAPRDGRTRR